MKQAALLIIGDEILSGKFADENAPFLIRRLRALGCRVRRVAILSDVVQDIAQETARSSADCDYVFTTGGVGPTHDDITMRSIAAAFDIPLESHPRLEQVLREKIRGDLTTAAMRMAQVPKGSELWWDGGMTFPLVVCRNVHIFPGVPSILRLKFEAVAERFRGEVLHTARVVTGEFETDIAERLEQAVARFPAVAIGSYPRYDEGPRHVIVTMEGLNAEHVAAARGWLEGVLKPMDLLT